MPVKLTAFSHGAGCGCKLSPEVLENVLGKNGQAIFEGLLVGNDTKDDAAVFDLDGETAIISTTDFFMPIVDDAHDFGAIASANAISDIYAMGGRPLMAIAILGWPIDKIPAEEASKVISGAREMCQKAGIPLAGGHSIDAPEPIFGLAVTGRVNVNKVRRNSDGRVGDQLYLSKPLGIGLVTTAQKREAASPEDLAIARDSMLTLNKLGEDLATFEGVNAITDVTGFGLAGHLIELAEASGCAAVVEAEQLPTFDFVNKYLEMGMVPGGTTRNWASYGHKVELDSSLDHRILADPQTSGGLLLSVNPESESDLLAFAASHGHHISKIGELTNRTDRFLVVR